MSQEDTAEELKKALIKYNRSRKAKKRAHKNYHRLLLAIEQQFRAGRLDEDLARDLLAPTDAHLTSTDTGDSDD